MHSGEKDTSPILNEVMPVESKNANEMLNKTKELHPMRNT